MRDLTEITNLINEVMLQDIKKQYTFKRISNILCNLGIQYGSIEYVSLLKEGIAMREYGLTYKKIDNLLCEKYEFVGG
jgi:hypothetical protein